MNVYSRTLIQQPILPFLRGSVTILPPYPSMPIISFPRILQLPDAAFPPKVLPIAYASYAVPSYKSSHIGWLAGKPAIKHKIKINTAYQEKQTLHNLRIPPFPRWTDMGIWGITVSLSSTSQPTWKEEHGTLTDPS